MSRLIAAALLLTCVSPLYPATRFEVEIQTNSRFMSLRGAAVTVDGPKILIDLRSKVEKVKMAVTQEPGSDAETVMRRYVARVSYETADEFEGHKIRISRSVTALITTDPAVSEIEWPADLIFSAGVPSIDEELRERMSMIEGFPVSIELSFSRIYHGGSPTTESMKVNVRDIREVTAPPELFERPPGYRNQKPVVAAPGS